MLKHQCGYDSVWNDPGLHPKIHQRMLKPPNMIGRPHIDAGLHPKIHQRMLKPVLVSGSSDSGKGLHPKIHQRMLKHEYGDCHADRHRVSTPRFIREC